MSFESFFQILDEFCSGLAEEVVKEEFENKKQQQVVVNKRKVVVNSKKFKEVVEGVQEEDEQEFDELINALTKADVFYYQDLNKIKSKVASRKRVNSFVDNCRERV